MAGSNTGLRTQEIGTRCLTESCHLGHHQCRRQGQPHFSQISYVQLYKAVGIIDLPIVTVQHSCKGQSSSNYCLDRRQWTTLHLRNTLPRPSFYGMYIYNFKWWVPVSQNNLRWVLYFFQWLCSNTVAQNYSTFESSLLDWLMGLEGKSSIL